MKQFTSYGSPSIIYCYDVLDQKGASTESLLYLFLGTKFQFNAYNVCIDIIIKNLGVPDYKMSDSEFIKTCLMIGNKI